MNEAKTFSYQTRCALGELECTIIQDYADLYTSVERHLFRDLIKKHSLNTLKKEYIAKYGITARQFNACRVSIEGKIAAVKASQEGRIENLKERISSLEKKLPKIKDKK